jgi:hypothetical protein
MHYVVQPAAGRLRRYLKMDGYGRISICRVMVART